MAQTNITITITTPTGMTVAEAIRLYADHNGYAATLFDPASGQQVSNPQTRAAFAKQEIARHVSTSIRNRRILEAQAAVSVPDDVTVE